LVEFEGVQNYSFALLVVVQSGPAGPL